VKALIMAGGKGSRISRHIPDIPKSCLNVGNQPLIAHTIDVLRENGIKEIAVVSGYKRDYLSGIVLPLNVEVFDNPFYEITNSIASMWFARGFIKDDDFLFINGDVFFANDVLNSILAETNDPVLLYDTSRKDEGDYMFYVKNNRLLNHGKDLSPELITGEYVGLAKVTEKFLPEFSIRLEEMIQGGKYNLWWENVLYSFIDECEVFVKDINGLFWGEVDYIEDYRRILNFLGINGDHK